MCRTLYPSLLAAPIQAALAPHYFHYQSVCCERCADSCPDWLQSQLEAKLAMVLAAAQAGRLRLEQPLVSQQGVGRRRRQFLPAAALATELAAAANQSLAQELAAQQDVARWVGYLPPVQCVMLDDSTAVCLAPLVMQAPQEEQGQGQAARVMRIAEHPSCHPCGWPCPAGAPRGCGMAPLALCPVALAHAAVHPAGSHPAYWSRLPLPPGEP
jgi:hypothetical protein